MRDRSDMKDHLQRGAAAGWLLGLGVVLLMVVAIPYFAAQNTNPNPNLQEPQGGGPGFTGQEQNNGLTIRDINNNVENYLGLAVRLEGEVDTVYSPRVFVLDQERAITGDEILVISSTPITPGPERTTDDPLQDTDEVAVVGQVQRLVIVDVERDLELDLDQEIETEFEGQPVIIADQVTPRENQ